MPLPRDEKLFYVRPRLFISTEPAQIGSSRSWISLTKTKQKSWTLFSQRYKWQVWFSGGFFAHLSFSSRAVCRTSGRVHVQPLLCHNQGEIPETPKMENLASVLLQKANNCIWVPHFSASNRPLVGPADKALPQATIQLVTIFSSEDSNANVWHVSGFLTTETISSSSGLRGEAEAGEFLTLPSPPLTHSPSEMPRQQENKIQQKPPEQLVCGLPTSPSYIVGPWSIGVCRCSCPKSQWIHGWALPTGFHLPSHAFAPGKGNTEQGWILESGRCYWIIKNRVKEKQWKYVPIHLFFFCTCHRKQASKGCSEAPRVKAETELLS